MIGCRTMPGRTDGRPSALRRSSRAGFTLVELIVASTIFAIFSTYQFAAWQTFTHMIGDEQERVGAVAYTHTARARLMADAQNAESFSCVTADRVRFDMGGVPTVLIDYDVQDDALIRYDDSSTNDLVAAHGISSLTCNSLGTEGLELDVEYSNESKAYHLYLMIAEATSP